MSSKMENIPPIVVVILLWTSSTKAYVFASCKMIVSVHCCVVFESPAMHLSRLMSESIKWHMRPAKTQISLGIRPVWSEASLAAWRKLGSLATHWAHSEDSDQTGRMGGCPGWSDSSLGAQTFCWFYHEVAHLSFGLLYFDYSMVFREVSSHNIFWLISCQSQVCKTWMLHVSFMYSRVFQLPIL